jgi:hypothetical protein
MKAIILHSVSDAKHCVKNRLYEGSMLLSTHSAVDVYLKEKHGLESVCLSSFMSAEEVVRQKNICSDEVDGLLKSLDSQLRNLLNKRFGLEMNYFTPMYSYIGKHHFLGYRCFVNCLKKARDEHGIGKILYYDRPLTDLYFNTKTTVRDIINLSFDGAQTEIVENEHGKYDSAAFKKKVFNVFKRILSLRTERLVSSIKMRLGLRDFGKQAFSDEKKTIVVMMPLYELEFLKAYLSKYNVFDPETCGRHVLPGLDPDFVKNNYRSDTIDPLLRLLLKDIGEDFQGTIRDSIAAVELVKRIAKRRRIDLGIWGIPPIIKPKRLVYEYLRSINTDIIGAQHGCTYGECIKPWHFDSDFTRCDHYISYGFTAEDLQRVCPEKRIDIDILPLGMVGGAYGNSRKRKIDILFPITNSISIFNSGMSRLLPHKLTHRQTRLLEYLDSLDELDVYVKPFKDFNYDNCSVMPVLKRLKNVKVVSDMTLLEFLKSHEPKSVLIEYPSMPLYDVIHLDAEIFLMNDDVQPYGRDALDELKRRVHYSDSVDEIIDKIGLFLKGRLEKKRDNTYYDHYVHKENTKENVKAFIESVLNKDEKRRFS